MQYFKLCILWPVTQASLCNCDGWKLHLPVNEKWDSCATPALQKLSLPETHKLSWGHRINEIIDSSVLPSWFHTEGLIGNESKQKWREEILIAAVGSPGLFTGALQFPRSTGLGKDPAVWFCAPVLPHTRGGGRYKAGLGGPDTFCGYFTHQLNTHELVPFSQSSILPVRCRERNPSSGLPIF